MKNIPKEIGGVGARPDFLGWGTFGSSATDEPADKRSARVLPVGDSRALSYRFCE